MKLFMMPQTVPNRPTKGAVEPMVASTPVPSADAPACRRLDPLKPGRDPVLMPFLVHVDRCSDVSSAIGAVEHCATAPSGTCARRLRRSWRRASSRSSVLACARGALISSIVFDSHTVQVTRREGETDHHRFDDHVGRMNMPQGLRSRGSSAAAIAVLSVSCADAGSDGNKNGSASKAAPRRTFGPSRIPTRPKGRASRRRAFQDRIGFASKGLGINVFTPLCSIAYVLVQML